MSTFVELAFRPTRMTDYHALTGTLIRRTRLGIAMDVGATLLSYLGRDPMNGHVCVSLYDSTATDAAMVLGLEWDYSPDADIDLPRGVEDRLKLVIDTAMFIKDAIGSAVCTIGISDGGYYYDTRQVPFCALIATMMEDNRSRGFTGNAYDVSF